MVDFFRLLKERRSIRKFSEKEIEEEKLEEILNAANSAPSAGNLQAYCIVVVTNTEKRKQLARAALMQSFIEEAPLSLVFFALPRENSGKYGVRGEQLYCVQDATIAAAYTQLAATALGLGSVWVGAFDDAAVKKTLNASADSMPVAIIAIGYPNEKPSSTSRKKLSDLVKRNGFLK